MSSRPTRDSELPCVTVPMRSCPRRLQPGQVKRYMAKGPLFGYMIACPSCGFTEMHEHKKAGFVDAADPEDDARDEKAKRPFILIAATNPMRCMLCARTLTIADRTIAARSPDQG